MLAEHAASQHRPDKGWGAAGITAVWATPGQVFGAAQKAVGDTETHTCSCRVPVDRHCGWSWLDGRLEEVVEIHVLSRGGYYNSRQYQMGISV
jgi:hypothetical protein